MWVQTSILGPENFKGKINVESICDAQIYAQYSDKKSNAFVLKKIDDKKYEYMTVKESDNITFDEIPGGDLVSYFLLSKKDSNVKINKFTPPETPTETPPETTTGQLPPNIDVVNGFSSNWEDPPDNSNKTQEMCRQLALSSNGKYVAWGHRPKLNTCFLYKQGFAPYNGNPSDTDHVTGCINPMEKVAKGCKI
jgi:hypothetical protein